MERERERDECGHRFRYRVARVRVNLLTKRARERGEYGHRCR